MIASTDLAPPARRELHALLEQDRASEQRFREAGDHVHDAALTALCYELAQRHRDFARELQRLLNEPGPASNDRPHLRRVERVTGWWRAVRRLTVGDQAATLRSLERTEARTRCRYDEALRRLRPPGVRRLLHQHHRSIRDAHKQLRALRRRYAERAG